MRQKLIRLLRRANLSEQEIQIYLTLLKLQSSTTTQITTQTGLNEMMVYRTLNNLKERGLITEAKLNDKQKIFSPLSLKALIETLEKEARSLNRLKNSLEDLDQLLPYLDEENDEESESIQIRDGLEAYIEEYLKIPQVADEEIFALGSICNFWQLLDWDLDTPEERAFINQRNKKGVRARLIHKYQEGAETIKDRDSLEKRTTQIKDNLPIMKNCMLMTEKDARLFICDKENPRVIVTTQPELLSLYKNQYEALWTR